MANFYPFGQPQQYSQRQNSFAGKLMPKNPIGDRGFKVLRNKGGHVNYRITEDDFYYWLCTHVHEGQAPCVTVLNNNLVRCNICGAVFDPKAKFDRKVFESFMNYVANMFNVIKINNNGSLSSEVLMDAAKSIAFMTNFYDMYEFVMSNADNNMFAPQFTATGYQNIGNQNRAVLQTGGVAYTPVYTSNQGAAYNQNPFMQPQQQGFQQQPQQYGQPQYPQQQPQQYGQPQYPQPMNYGQPQYFPPQPQQAPSAAAATVAPDQPVAGSGGKLTGTF